MERVMDPDECLLRSRQLAARIVNEEGTCGNDAVELAECFEALDRWLTRGGFYPRAWARLPMKKEKWK